MAPFVPRQRKHKVRRRNENEGDSDRKGLDSNAPEITPVSQTSKEKQKKLMKASLRAGLPKFSGKKQKRLDKYIDKKLRKDETVELIRKLEGAKVDTALLRSSRELGANKQAKQQVLDRASKDHRSKINTRILKRSISSSSSGSDNEAESSDTGDDDGTTTKVQSIPQHQTPNATLGSGLKRGLDLTSPDQPLGKKRKLDAELSSKAANDEVIPWEGFSSLDEQGESEEVSSSSTSSVGSQADSESEASDDSTESDQDRGEAPYPSRIVKPPRRRSERSSAFKAWASQQVNEALGFQPTAENAQLNAEQHPGNSLKLKLREAEQEPLPPELKTESAVPDRRSYSVRVERTAETHEARMKLPVVAEEQKIMEAIYNNPTVVVWGATGSGKTTQVPQFLYEAGFGAPGGPTPGMIGVTQPRRVAAVSMAKRVANELGGLHSKVSYQIRFETSVSKETALKFMTDGILIREIANDFALLKYSVMIIDEAHERSANTDILIGMLGRIVDLRAAMHHEDPKSAPLKLVIMSATLRIADFIDNRNLFRNGPPPVLQAEGRQFPVTPHFSRRTQWNYLDEMFQKVSRGHRKLPPGGMLVFLTGQNEITALAKRLREAFTCTTTSEFGHQKVTIAASEAPLEAEDVDLGGDALNPEQQQSENEGSDGDDSEEEFDIEEPSTQGESSQIHVLPLYSQLQTKDQLRVFEPPPEGARLIVLATNVAETSLTIPGIRYVFDCGRSKERKYDQVTGVQSFEVGWISKASASQRAGRAGRTSPGHCYRLYSSAVYERDFEEHAEPEILRMPVEGVVLQLKSMDLQHVVNFPFPTPPDRYSLAKAEKLLSNLGALTATGKVTPIGLELSTYPLSPRFAKMLTIGHQHDCMPYTIAMVSALAVPGLFILENQLDLSEPARDSDAVYSTADRLADSTRTQRRKDYNKAHQLLSKNSPTSDALKTLSALCAFAFTPSAEAFASEMFLSPKALKEASRLRHQLSTIVQNSYPAKLPSKYESCLPEPSAKQLKALQQILAAAFIDQIAIRADVAPSPPEMPRKPTRAIDVPYLPLFRSHEGRADDLVDIAVFVHPSSVLARSTPRDLPEYIVYSHLQRNTPATVDGAKRPRTRMHALCSVTGKQITALARNSPLLEYSKPIGKIVELERGKRECWVVPELVGDKGGRRWPLPAQKVVQGRQGKEGWIVEKILS